MTQNPPNSTHITDLTQWVEAQGYPVDKIESASSDASFRHYYRLYSEDDTYILMDAPPDKENSEPFVAVANAMLELGLNVPEIFAMDLDRGFLLLSDLGSTQYLAALTPERVDRLYGDALGALNQLQVCSLDHPLNLPPYDADLLQREMDLFPAWYLEKHLALVLSPAQKEVLQAAFDVLATSALQQPAVWVHRDYHSRNLMVDVRHNPGVLDFQDAVKGPITYDLVSLLKDCYIQWSEQQIQDWALGFYDLAIQSGTLKGEEVSKDQFLRWFDWMGVQRHLKAIGIFARLFHRDGKEGYLKDIPRTLSYIKAVAGKYKELHAFQGLMEELGVY